MNSEPDYSALAEFRRRIREFLCFSERAARAAGLEPAQHQALLALKGLPEHERPTIRAVADRLLLRHHSAVGLVDRLSRRGLVRRARAEADGREIRLSITARGEKVLRRLALAHRAELRSGAPQLVRSLRLAIRNRGEGAR
jgi:DNA-binding MarR family transcriptional regulator